MSVVRGYRVYGQILALVAAAICFPLPLYLVSLALFGVPHVVWEMGFIRQRYLKLAPTGWWLALGGVLLCDASARLVYWLGLWSGEKTGIINMLALLLLALLVVLVPSRISLRARIAGLCLVGVVGGLLNAGEVALPLLLLGLIHNFSPLPMLWDMTRDTPSLKPLAWQMTGLFLIPLLLACTALPGIALPEFMQGYVPLLDGQWPPSWAPAHRAGLWSAAVFAQCLHYFSVIYLLPKVQQQQSGQAILPRWAKIVTLLAALGLVGYYAVDYGTARKLYMVMAGIHAWLEWPVLLIALLGMQPPSARQRQDTAPA